MRKVEDSIDFDWDWSTDSYRLYTCKRYIPRQEDSGQGPGITLDTTPVAGGALNEETQPREATPDPRQPISRRPTPESQTFQTAAEMFTARTLFQTSQNTQLMDTIPTAEAGIGLEKERVEEMDQEDGDDSLDRIMNTSPLTSKEREKLDRLMSNLYVPESPGHHGVKGEAITPNTSNHSKLSPEAEPFRPKRLNTTSISELQGREQSEWDYTMKDTNERWMMDMMNTTSETMIPHSTNQHNGARPKTKTTSANGAGTSRTKDQAGTSRTAARAPPLASTRTRPSSQSGAKRTRK